MAQSGMIWEEEGLVKNTMGRIPARFEPLLEQPTQPGIHHGKGEPGEIFQTDVLCGPSP